MIRFAIHPGTGEVRQGTTPHAFIINDPKDYDNWVRALWFPEKKVLYFRYYDPDYYQDRRADPERAFAVCTDALRAVKRAKAVPRNVRVLFWQEGYGIKDQDIKY